MRWVREEEGSSGVSFQDPLSHVSSHGVGKQWAGPGHRIEYREGTTQFLET